MNYKAVIIAAALLAAPLAFAEDNQGGGQGMPPPPPHGGPGFFQMHFEGGEDGQRPEMGNQMFGRGPGPMGSTTGEVHMRFMGTSTRPLFDDEHGPRMMGSSTDEMHGTSTPRGEGPRPGPGFFLGIFKKLFGGPHDNGNSSTTPPQMRGEVNGDGQAQGDVEGEQNDNGTSTPPKAPPAQVIQFFQNFFSRFFGR